MKIKFIALALLVMCALSLTATQVLAKNELEIQYSQELVESVSFYKLLILQDTFELKKGLWFKGAVGIGDIMNFSHRAYFYETSAYQKIPGLPGYSLGVEYKYYYDEESQFAVGGEFERFILTLRFLGAAEVGETKLICGLAYTPAGAYKFLGQDPLPLTGFNLSLGVDVPVYKALRAKVEAVLGSENYNDETYGLASYRFGATVNF